MPSFTGPGGAPIAVIRKRIMPYQQIPAGRTVAPEEMPTTEFLAVHPQRQRTLATRGFPQN
jgi:hypothetical protein